MGKARETGSARSRKKGSRHERSDRDFPSRARAGGGGESGVGDQHRDRADPPRTPAPEPRGFLRSHIELPGLRWHQVSLEHTSDRGLAPFTEALDLMGDGSLTLLPTPGHTAGSVSLLVRRAGRPPLLLVGDLTYGADILQRGQFPGVGSRRRLAESSHQVLALAGQQPGLVVLPAHDPTAAQRLLDS